MAIDRRGATQKPKQKKQTKPKKVNQKPKKAEPKLPSYQPKAKTPTQIKPKKKEVKKEDQLFLSPNSRYSDSVGLKCILGINIVLKGPQMALTCSQVEPLMV